MNTEDSFLYFEARCQTAIATENPNVLIPLLREILTTMPSRKSDIEDYEYAYQGYSFALAYCERLAKRYNAVLAE